MYGGLLQWVTLLELSGCICMQVLIGYRNIGCWKDRAIPAIPSLEGKNIWKLDGHYSNRVQAIKKCYLIAVRRGFKYFALQNGGLCASSRTAGATYKKYGWSKRCKGDGKGGLHANRVYKITVIRNYRSSPSDKKKDRVSTMPAFGLVIVPFLVIFLLYYLRHACMKACVSCDKRQRERSNERRRRRRLQSVSVDRRERPTENTIATPAAGSNTHNNNNNIESNYPPAATQQQCEPPQRFTSGFLSDLLNFNHRGAIENRNQTTQQEISSDQLPAEQLTTDVGTFTTNNSSLSVVLGSPPSYESYIPVDHPPPSYEATLAADQPPSYQSAINTGGVELS